MKTELPDQVTKAAHPTPHSAAPEAPETGNFVETALKLSGKSEEEARTTGKIDRADDQVEALFATKYQTSHSPVHRAVWSHEVPVDLFAPEPPSIPADTAKVMADSIAVAERHRAAGTLLDDRRKPIQRRRSHRDSRACWTCRPGAGS